MEHRGKSTTALRRCKFKLARWTYGLDKMAKPEEDEAVSKELLRCWPNGFCRKYSSPG
jgi:hypothetical protein